MSVQTKRILVLGASGRVGRLLRLVWEQSPPSDVELLFQSRTGPGVHWEPGQPNPFGQLDAVISLWGVTHGTQTELAANTTLALAAQDLAAQAGADRVLHCSSIAVYAPKDGMLAETDLTDPPNAYGWAKLAMEQALENTAGPKPVILRIGSVAGAESLAGSIQQGWQGTASAVTLDQFANGKGPARSYIAPTDLARVLIRLAVHPFGDLPGVVNVGGPVPVHMETLLQAAGHPMIWKPAPSAARQYAVLDCGRLSKLLPLSKDMSEPKHIMEDWLMLEGRI
ncbi:MAG: NAD-dependent epimerase/dehydratase family protein [Thalassovita sp.]